jgi:hypothetical protein
MSETGTTRSRLEDLIREAEPEVKRHTDRLAPEGSNLAERAFALVAALNRVALDRYKELAKSAPKGSDDRKWLVGICSMLRSDLGQYQESLGLARAMRESARRRLVADNDRLNQAMRAAPSRMSPGQTTPGAGVPPRTVRRADRRRAGTP